jgi:hypothetical protein
LANQKRNTPTQASTTAKNAVVAQSQTADPDQKADEVLKTYGQELTKQLLSNTIDYVRTTSQQLQTITSILLSSYIAIFFGLGKQFGLPQNVSVWYYIGPMAFFTLSLIFSFLIALFSRASQSAPGDWESLHTAFYDNLKRRQKQIYLPALCSLIGLIWFVFIVFIAW